MNEQIIERLFANRTLALDRTALPALASIAQLRAGSASLEELSRHRAGMFDDPASRRIKVQHAGATAIVPLVGVLTTDPLLAWLFGGTHPDAFAAALDEAVYDPAFREVVVVADSPGGEVSLITETAARMRSLRNVKPITAIARSTMCSAAYWLGASASSVVASPSSHVGSVGVYLIHADESRLLDKVGISVSYITSDPRKVEGNPTEPLADEARAHLQRGVDEVYGQFIADLGAGLGTSNANVRANFGGGRAFGAAEALRRGMVSKVATLESLLAGFAASRSDGRPGARAGVIDDAAIQADVDAARAAAAIAEAL